MKILELTPHRIVLRDRAISFWLSAVCLILGGLTTIALGKLTTLTCHRGLVLQSQCQLSRFGTLGIGSSQQLLNNLQGATVDRHYSSKGGTTYAVILSTGLGTVQLGSHYGGDRQGKETIAAQINAFVDNPQQLSLQVQQDDRLWMLLFGSLLLGSGAISVALCQVTRCSLDQMTGKLRIVRWSVRGMQVSEYPLHQVISAELDTRVRRYKGRLHKSYRITFQMLNGKPIHLNRFYAEDRPRPEVASALARFLATRPASTWKREAIAPQSENSHLNDSHPDEAETLYRLGMEQYRQHQTQEASTNLKRARDLFSTQHNPQRVMEIQTVLWQLGLE